MISSLDKINTSWKDEKRQKQTRQILKFHKKVSSIVSSISLYVELKTKEKRIFPSI